MTVVVAFWAVALVIAVFALPLAFRLFRRFPDGGAGLAFALGLTLTGWIYFTLRTLDVLPVGRGGAVLAVALLGLLGCWVAGRDRRFMATMRIAWPGTIAVAGLFTLFFFSFVVFRSYTPEIGGTEQPMDLMYLNAAMTSPEYPPHDPWLAGESASYYYFGYVQVGILTQVSGVNDGAGYNLGLAYTFAASAAGIASLTFALGRWVLGRRARNWAFGTSIAGIVLLLFLGSLAGALELMAAHGWGGDDLYEAAGVEWLRPCDAGEAGECRPESDRWYPTRFFFWFEDTRVIRSAPDVQDTITEFPAFSFILGDLHPHVMSMPLVLLAIAIAAAAWRGRGPLRLASLRIDPLIALVLGLLLGALAFQNAWDLLTFSGLVAISVLARNLRLVSLWPATRDTAGYLGPIAALAIIGYLPWYLDFGSQAEGLYPYVGKGSHPGQAFLQFGPLFLAGLLSLAWSLRRTDLRDFGDAALYTAWVPLGPLLLWIALAQYHGDLGDAVDARSRGGWVTLATYGIGAWALATAFAVTAIGRRVSALPLGLAATGILLFYGAELFVIKDVFFGSVPRLNTVFKLTYQAWVLLSVAGAVALVVALQRALRDQVTPAWLVVPVGATAFVGLVFVTIAVPNRTDGFDGPTEIDGLGALARADPAEYHLVRWLEDNVPVDEVVLEATGRQYGRGQGGTPTITDGGVDYGEGGRISARTGLQTPIGWYFHEIQWRGDTPENRAELTRRQDLVDQAYISSDAATAASVMRELGASYLIVASVERAKYGDFLPDFGEALDLAFESGEYRVYRLPISRTVATS